VGAVPGRSRVHPIREVEKQKEFQPVLHVGGSARRRIGPFGRTPIRHPVDVV
jgi:hypothetical protein